MLTSKGSPQTLVEGGLTDTGYQVAIAFSYQIPNQVKMVLDPQDSRVRCH